MPKNIGLDAFQDPVGHFGPTGRQCGIAGGERVPPVLLGWYSSSYSFWGRLLNVHNVYIKFAFDINKIRPETPEINFLSVALLFQAFLVQINQTFWISNFFEIWWSNSDIL